MFLFIVIVVLIGFVFFVKHMFNEHPNFSRVFFPILLISAFPIYALVSDDLEAAIVVIKIEAVIIFIGSFIVGVSYLTENFYNFNTIMKFIAVKFFTLGVTDKQKIIKLKKINKLVVYAKEKKEESEEKANKKMLEKLFLRCSKNYKIITNSIKKSMSEYINSGYVTLKFSEPTRENINGAIRIYTKSSKPVMKITIRGAANEDEEGYYFYYLEPNPFLDSSDSLKDYSSNSPNAIINKAKKYLLKYFESNIEELDK